MDTAPEWMGRMQIRRRLWQEFGVPADLDLPDSVRAVAMLNAEDARAKALAKRSGQS